MPGEIKTILVPGGKKATKLKKLKLVSAPSLKRQVTANKKAIDKIESASLPYRPFYQSLHEVVNVNGPHVHLLTQPTNWTKCFSTYEQDSIPRQYFMRSIDFSWIGQAESASVGNLYVQVLIVSLKRKSAAKVIQRTTRLSNMTEDLDYISAQAGSTGAGQGPCMFKLNPIFYTVHYNSGQRRIGNATIEDTAVTNINNTTTMGKAKVKWRKEFKNDEHTENGFLDIDYDHIEPHNQLYCVVFSNSEEAITNGDLFFSYRLDINGNCNMPE